MAKKKNKTAKRSKSRTVKTSSIKVAKASAVPKKEETKTSQSMTGLGQNGASALSYLVGAVTGILFLLIDGKNKTVKFHAIQSILWSVGLYVIQILLVVSIVGILLLPLLWLVTVVSWLYLMWQAYEGKKYKLPIVGDIAENMAK